MNCYETKAGHLKPVDCARLSQKEEEISSDQSSSPEVLICEGSIVYVRKSSQPPIQPSPFYLGRVDGNMYAVENPADEGYLCLCKILNWSVTKSY